MSRAVIISCAVTGAADSKGSNPAVPVTPEEIANEAIAANKAGAAIAHVHVRNVETGKASMDTKLYKEVVDRIRDSGSPVIINLTTGPGGRFSPDRKDPIKAAQGSVMKTAVERVAHVVENKPDICSLDVATMNFGERPMVNAPDMLNEMAGLIQDAGVKPELEVFDTGHVRLANHMLETNVIKDDKPLYQLCLGIPWGAPANAETMMLMRDMLPPTANWASFGISRFEFPMVASAVLLGGHARVGLEDNLYIARGKLASGNAQLVERAVQIVESTGDTVASPAEARQILGL
ncbi:MAG: NADPH:quinone reductase [Alphaproteobacteria bacterium]|nr:NADPH:quinone reductase [Alphaproteobacteria bacterium]HCP01105.1 NADPH:quinone reductase [Rhodospirillaceae bacterium]